MCRVYEYTPMCTIMGFQKKRSSHQSILLMLKYKNKDGHYEQYCPFFYGKKEVNEDSKK